MSDIARHRLATLRAAGVDPSRADRPGTLVLPEAHRAGSDMVVVYFVDELTMLRCDPALADRVRALESDRDRTDLDALTAWVESNEWDLVEGGDQRLLGSTPRRIPELPEGATLTALDRSNDEHRQRIADLIDASDPDDVEEAELDLDDLDPLIVALLRDDGSIGAYASSCAWDLDASFDDIGILTHRAVQRRGWGATAVSALIDEIQRAGRIPLYRYNWSRVASKRLASSLGFELVGSLVAIAPAGLKTVS